MSVRRLPTNPSLDHLKYQAKDLIRDHAARECAVAQRLREFHPRFQNLDDAEIFELPLKLSDAQLAIARESGFASWARLKRHIEKPMLTDRLDLPHHERIKDATFRRAVDMVDAGDAEGLRRYLREHPELVHQHIAFEGWNYFHNPTLLEFVAGNPVRHETLPKNIVEVARVIMDAGAERDKSALNKTLELVATGRVARECGVQLRLLDLLCERGADPNSAIHGAGLHGEAEAVDTLLGLGARTTLAIAAALGRSDEFRRLLSGSGSDERHLAMSVAAGCGRVELMRMLLDVGEDPNRYNPVGGHSHTTPLHQAAAIGNLDMVRLLVERGARVEMKDILWHGTPADWARHEGKREVEEYLRAQEFGSDHGFRLRE